MDFIFHSITVIEKIKEMLQLLFYDIPYMLRHNGSQLLLAQFEKIFAFKTQNRQLHVDFMFSI